MTKTEINRRREKAIRTYVRKGYSANKIQKKLQKQGLGTRRKDFLAKVRRIKRVKGRVVEREKYVPRKYVKISIIPIITTKHVTLTGKHHHKRTSKTKIGSGRELFNFVRKELTSGFWDAKPKIES
jgi:hypothetical protein